jgi:hypothetical protein
MRFTRTDDGWQQHNLAEVELMVERHECDAPTDLCSGRYCSTWEVKGGFC